VNANTGASTLNITGIPGAFGAKNIYKNGSSAIISGDIIAGQTIILSYDGANFQIMGGIGVGGSLSGLTSGRIPVTNSSTSITDYQNLTYDGSNTVLSIGSTASPQYGYIKLRRSTTSTPNDLLGQMEYYNNTNLIGYTKVFNANSGTGSVYQIGVSATTSVTAQLNIDGTLNAMRYTGSDGSNNSVTYQQRWTHSTTGTPAIGIGSGIEFETQTASTPTLKIGSRIESVSTNVTGGSEAFDLIFKNMSGGSTAAEKIRLTSTGQLGINTSSPDASALVDITSTTKGFLPPRMTGAQAEAISSPAAGLLVYANNGNGSTITSTGWWGYTGSTWVKLN
jgi:hypothetical protein